MVNKLLYPGEGPVPRKIVNARAEGRVSNVGRSPQLFKEKPVPTRVGYWCSDILLMKIQVRASRYGACTFQERRWLETCAMSGDDHVL
jgi:hypothetical protein